MSSDHRERDYFINDKDYELWLSSKDDLAEILHLKAKLLTSCEAESSSAASNNEPPKGSAHNPLYKVLEKKMKRVTRILRAQWKLAEEARERVTNELILSKETEDKANTSKLMIEALDLDMRAATIDSEITRVWKIPAKILESEFTKKYVTEWAEGQGGRMLAFLAEGRAPLEEDMVTQAGD
ncbi:hypothetical protein F5Y19DRAFT_439234 [Xylariaceae sp. FL1651]|nr:hypothetical protein F5Y19DRAFT_439234 [Xylariaceae sp. FL1651]